MAIVTRDSSEVVLAESTNWKVAGSPFRLNYHWFVVVRCPDCDARDVKNFHHLARKNTQPCSCNRNCARPEHRVWSRMHERCGNPNHVHYDRYGGRGISVCERWSGSTGFKAFLSDMGPRPSNRHEIDRIDNDGNYEPGNCRWVTASQNGRNKRNNRVIEIDGVSRCVSEWAEQPGASNRFKIYQRLNMGWTPRNAVFGKVG